MTNTAMRRRILHRVAGLITGATCRVAAWFLSATLLLNLSPMIGRAGDNDFAAPALAVTSHANGQIVNTRTIVLQGTATDAGRGGHGISSVNARGNAPNATAAGDGTVLWSQTITLSPGANSISVYAYDNSTSQNYATVTLTINFQPVDSAAPTLRVTSHAQGATVNTKTIVLEGTASDGGTGNNGISSVTLQGTLPGSSTAGAGTVNWSREVTLHRGPNDFYITAADASDVQNERLLILTINFQPTDPLPPTLQITSHANGQTVTTSTIVVSGTATDAGTGNSGIGSVYLQGTLPNASAAGAATVNWSRSVELRPGANQLYIYAYDQSDVVNEVLKILTINFAPDDSQAPLLNVTSHANGETVFVSNIVLTGTATDAGRGDHGISSIYLQGTLPDVGGTGSQVVNWSKNVTLSPGKNYIAVYAYDRNQFPNEASVNLIINFQPADTLGPNLAILSHTEGQTVTTPTVTLSGTASDAGRGDNGISEVTLQGRIDGATTVGAGQVNWSRVVQLSPGRNTFYVRASDKSPFPNTTEKLLTLFLQPLDSLPPTLAITSHTEGQVVFSNVLILSGTASDAGRGNHGISGVRVNFVRADNDTATGADVAHWSRTFALNPGHNSVYISAQDDSEFPQETQVTLSITYQVGDLNPPNLTIDQPRNQVTVNNPTLLVSGTASDAGQGGSGVTGVTVNGATATGGVAVGSAVASWSRTVNLIRGLNLISVVTEDGSPAKNSSAQTLRVTYEPNDLEPPALEITSHRNGQAVKTSTITLAGTATDAGLGGSGIALVTVGGIRATSDTATASATANWSRQINLNLGPNVISVVARDGANNDTARTLTLHFEPTDTAPPDLVITSHRKGQIVSTPSVLLAGTASDANQGASGIADVTVDSLPTAGGTASGAATAQWTRTVNLKLGPNILSIVAHDNSPNRNVAAETLTLIYEPVDLTPPDLVVTSHKSGQTVAGDRITLAGTATDQDLGDNGIGSVTVKGAASSGGTATGAATAHWSRVLNLAPGENVISVVASDASPRQNSSAVTLTLIYDPQLATAPPDFCWALDGGGVSAGYAIAKDAGGNSYVTGTFEGGASLGGTNVLSRGETDVFVAKYDAGGRLLWARQAGGTNADAGLGIAVDIQGACYVTGYFSGMADFGGRVLKTTGTYDLFLAKYDPDGRLSWATNTGAGSGLYGRAIAVDSLENSYLTGGFVYDARFGNNVFSNNELSDIFVAKYGPTGDLLWARQMGGEEEDLGTGIGVDPAGGCYTTGYFTDAGSFGETFLTTAGSIDLFVARFDADGNVKWVRQAGDLGKTQGSSLSVDPQGNCLVAGYFDLLTAFGDDSFFTDGFYDYFLAKYDPTGEVLWVRNSETSNAISAAGVATDGDGSAYITGTFFGPAEFKNATLTNGSTAQIFVAKYDADGNFVWARQAGGPLDDTGFAVATDAGGDWVLTGTTSGLATFGSRVLNSGGIARLVVAGGGGRGVDSPIHLSIQWLSSMALQIQYLVGACDRLQLEGSSDLQQWTPIPTPESVDNVVTHVEDVSASRAQRYFRVVSP